MIKDSVFLVTGGASGLGESAAEMLLSEGACVVILDLQLPADNGTLRAYGDKVLCIQVDVTSEKDVENAIDATKRKFGKLNGIINSAGIYVSSPIYDFKTKEPHSLQEFTKVITVNLIGTFNVTRLAIPLLLENEPNSDNERGIIINVSSTFGHQTPPGGVSAYAASKAGIKAMSRPLTKELSSYGIRVVDIAPAIMDTPLTNSYELNHRSTLTDVFVCPKPRGKTNEFAAAVKSVIENLPNGTSIKIDGALEH